MGARGDLGLTLRFELRLVRGLRLGQTLGARRDLGLLLRFKLRLVRGLGLSLGLSVSGKLCLMLRLELSLMRRLGLDLRLPRGFSLGGRVRSGVLRGGRRRCGGRSAGWPWRRTVVAPGLAGSTLLTRLRRPGGLRLGPGLLL